MSASRRRISFLPRWVGILVVLSGPIYLIGSYTSLLAPHLADAFTPAYTIPLIAETALCVSLFLAGRKLRPRRKELLAAHAV